jgi:predicted RNA-binding Zn-ribbon protein involved in translation (DUF1610 family)
MSHYVIPGGAFEQAYQQLASTGWKLNLESAARENATAPKNPNNTRTKFTCPQCGLNAWAKPDAKLLCGSCNQPLMPA